MLLILCCRFIDQKLLNSIFLLASPVNQSVDSLFLKKNEIYGLIDCGFECSSCMVMILLEGKHGTSL
jgi:hypothetical protein